MSPEDVNTLVAQLLKLSPPTVAPLEAALGTSLKPTGQNNHWTSYEFELAGGPFAGGELRLSRDASRALLSLRPRDDAPLLEDGFDLGPYGPLANIVSNPDIPSEGTDSYIFRPSGVRLAFQFMHQSRRLRTLVLEWGAAG
jgi:hypothetical protein